MVCNNTLEWPAQIGVQTLVQAHAISGGIKTAASGVREGWSGARAISGYGNAASHTRRVSEGTRDAKDVQIQSLPVVLLIKKAPLSIERNTAPSIAHFLNRYVLFTLYYPCTKFKEDLITYDEDIAPEAWRLFTPEFCAVKYAFLCHVLQKYVQSNIDYRRTAKDRLDKAGVMFSHRRVGGNTLRSKIVRDWGVYEIAYPDAHVNARKPLATKIRSKLQAAGDKERFTACERKCLNYTLPLAKPSDHAVAHPVVKIWGGGLVPLPCRTPKFTAENLPRRCLLPETGNIARTPSARMGSAAVWDDAMYWTSGGEQTAPMTCRLRSKVWRQPSARVKHPFKKIRMRHTQRVGLRSPAQSGRVQYAKVFPPSFLAACASWFDKVATSVARALEQDGSSFKGSGELASRVFFTGGYGSQPHLVRCFRIRRVIEGPNSNPPGYIHGDGLVERGIGYAGEGPDVAAKVRGLYSWNPMHMHTLLMGLQAAVARSIRAAASRLQKGGEGGFQLRLDGRGWNKSGGGWPPPPKKRPIAACGSLPAPTPSQPASPGIESVGLDDVAAESQWDEGGHRCLAGSQRSQLYRPAQKAEPGPNRGIDSPPKLRQQTRSKCQDKPTERGSVNGSVKDESHDHDVLHAINDDGRQGAVTSWKQCAPGNNIDEWLKVAVLSDDHGSQVEPA
ncbi:hypothetical protein HYPSUDRAFT_59871 [Hypholoma sublateritium FD-334 SS-4]|uniref:Uncharacterized protein n=1 Tax=Hypholoma sublateritium (strain FD-334 SS-4) TaxID=945553 RepID=A0A0D2LRP1_HYPSF|nr:hypothetical protein HYPSUDRAFT_59871 [Hypholoma sublateritium FD-334 SS-4]